MKPSLINKTILVTGACGGLGQSIAIALAQQGAKVVLLDKNIAKLELLYDKIAADTGLEPALYPFDFSGANISQYHELALTIQQKYGHLDGLIHTAADLGFSGPVISIDPENWVQIMNINLHAPFLLTQVLLPVLQKTSNASIVFTSDSAFREPKAYGSAYCVAKIALEGFAKILAEEMESAGKIRVNTFIPGPINSPIRHKAFPGEDSETRVAVASITPVYVYLSSDESIGQNGLTFEAKDFLETQQNTQVDDRK